MSLRSSWWTAATQHQAYCTSHCVRIKIIYLSQGRLVWKIEDLLRSADLVVDDAKLTSSNCISGLADFPCEDNNKCIRWQLPSLDVNYTENV